MQLNEWDYAAIYGVLKYAVPLALSAGACIIVWAMSDKNQRGQD